MGAYPILFDFVGEGAALIIKDDSNPVSDTTTTINFTGDGVSATETSSGSGVVTVNIPGGSSAVSSVFSRTGAVIAQIGDYSTSLVTENTNLYFTDARAIAAALTGYTSGAGTIASTDSILTAIQKLNGNIGALTTGVSSVNSLTGAVALTGTASRLSISSANVFDIDVNYAGQNTITTLGTIGTGTWQGTSIVDTYISSAANWNKGSAGVIFDGAGGVIATNTVAYVQVPYKGDITGWQIVANAIGACTITVKKGTFPPTSTIISPSPAMPGGTQTTSATITPIAVTAGDWLSFTISGVSTVAWVNLTLLITKIV